MSKPFLLGPDIPPSKLDEDIVHSVKILTEMNELGVALATGLLRQARADADAGRRPDAAAVAESFERIANSIYRSVQLIDKLLQPVAARPRPSRDAVVGALLQEARRRLAEQERAAQPRPVLPPPRKGPPYLH